MWKLVSSYFSFGEWILSDSSEKPIISESIFNWSLKAPTIGIDPPQPANHRLGAPFGGERAASPRQRLGGKRQIDRRRGAVRDEPRLAIVGQARLHEGAESGDDRLRILLRDQPERELGAGLGRAARSSGLPPCSRR